MASTQYLNLLEPTNLIVTYDFKPWGGISPPTSLPIPGAKVNKITLNSGATFDTAEISLPESNFGDDIPYYMPVKIIYTEPVEGTQVVIFKGFLNSSEQTLDSANNRVKITCLDYKWYYSNVSTVRGRWYKNNVAGPQSPTQLGSGLSIGDQKFNFEKFRAPIQDNSGYLQNEQCIFNNNELPDCFVNNTIGSTNNIFFMDQIGYNENAGLPDDFFQAKDVGGFYWTYATILKHIEQFWIDPYNAVLAGLELHNGDLINVREISDDNNKPLGYSLENTNPIAAIDKVVRSLPGKWIWYLDYNNNTNRVKVRIKQIFDQFTTSTINLTAGDDCEKLINSDANLSSVTVTRNINKVVKNVIARGGKLKIITTIKLVPLWTKFDGLNFRDVDDIKDYLFFIDGLINQKDNPLIFENEADQEKKLRYLRLFRYYGIPIDGRVFKDNVVSSSIGSEGGISDLQLTGDIANQYSSLSTDLLEMMFNNAKIDREIDPPQFNRYSDDIVVFMHDNIRTGEIGLNDVTIGSRVVRTESDAELLLTEIEEDNKWIIPDEANIDYNIDQKNGIVSFSNPQVQRYMSLGKSHETELEDVSNYIAGIRNNILNGADEATEIAKIISRDVYMTATFTLDISGIISRKVSSDDLLPAFTDVIDGPPFSGYVQQNNSHIIVHSNAFYPINSDQKDVINPNYISTEMDNHILSTKIRSGTSFDNYQYYVSLGAREMMAAIRSVLQGNGDLDESITATLPYLELGYNIGDNIKEINNTNYVDLRSYLVSIIYQSIGETDVFNTIFNMNNNYDSNKNEVALINKNQQLNADGNKRQTLTYTNSIENLLT